MTWQQHLRSRALPGLQGLRRYRCGGAQAMVWLVMLQASAPAAMPCFVHQEDVSPPAPARVKARVRWMARPGTATLRTRAADARPASPCSGGALTRKSLLLRAAACRSPLSVESSGRVTAVDGIGQHLGGAQHGWQIALAKRRRRRCGELPMAPPTGAGVAASRSGVGGPGDGAVRPGPLRSLPRRFPSGLHAGRVHVDSGRRSSAAAARSKRGISRSGVTSRVQSSGCSSWRAILLWDDLGKGAVDGGEPHSRRDGRPGSANGESRKRAASRPKPPLPKRRTECSRSNNLAQALASTPAWPPEPTRGLQGGQGSIGQRPAHQEFHRQVSARGRRRPQPALAP